MKDRPTVNSAPAATTAAAAPRPIVTRAPLLPACALLIGGIVAGRYLAPATGVWAAAGALALAVAALTLRRPVLAPVTSAALACAIVCGGAVATTLARDRLPADHVFRFSARGNVFATIRGTIVSAPRTRAAAAAYERPPTTAFLLDATAIRRTDGRWTGATGRLRATVGEPASGLAAGDDVELVGTIRRSRPPGNPGQYDWPAADRNRGILARFAVPGADGVTRLGSADAGSPRRLWWRLRGHVRQHVVGFGDSREATLLEALVLGERDPSLRKLNQSMIDAGTAHFLSISGMHLGIFLGFVYGLCRLLALRPRRAAMVVLAVLAGYVFLAEPRAPLLRAAVMAAAVCIAMISGRAVTVANALAAAAALLLAADPLALFRPGFQLSFGVVAGMLLMYRPVRQLLFGRWLKRRGLMVFRSDQRWVRWLQYRAADVLIALVSVSTAAYLVAAPLVACHFGLLTPYAPLLSILLLPLMIAVLIPAYLSMALAWPLPNLAARIADLAAGAAGWLEKVVALSAKLPGLSFDLYPVPAWWAGLWYAALLLWAARPRRRRLALGALAVAVGAGLWTQLPAPAPTGAQLHVLAVGHGSAALLQSPTGKTYLFDAGSLTSAGICDEVLRPFLRARRLPAPEAVFISHANVDHFNALTGWLERHSLRTAYVHESFGRGSDTPPEAGELLRLLERRGVRVVRLRQGQTLSLGGDTRVEVLWPPPVAEAPQANENDRSLVLRLVAGRRSVLLPGDAGEGPQAALAKLPRDRIGADVLVLPHHGSHTPSLAGFIEAVDPQLLIQSAAARRSSDKLLRAIAGRPRVCTFREGWIGVDLAGEAVGVETMRPRLGAPVDAGP